MPRPLSASFKRRPLSSPTALPSPDPPDLESDGGDIAQTRTKKLANRRSLGLLAREPTTMSATYLASSNYGTLPRRTVTSELSDFLRDTGPPDFPTTAPSLNTKESSNGLKARFFGGKGKKPSSNTDSARRFTASSYMSTSSALSAISLPNTKPKRFASGQTILMINTPAPPSMTSLASADALYIPESPSSDSHFRLGSPPTASLIGMTNARLSPIDAVTSDAEQPARGFSNEEDDFEQEPAFQLVSVGDGAFVSYDQTPRRSGGSKKSSHSPQASSFRSAAASNRPTHSAASSISIAGPRPSSAPAAVHARKASKSSKPPPPPVPTIPLIPDETFTNVVHTPPPQSITFSPTSLSQPRRSPPTSNASSPRSSHSAASPPNAQFLSPASVPLPPLTPPIEYKGFKFPVPPLTSSPSESSSSGGTEVPTPRPDGTITENEESDGEPSVINHGATLTINGRSDPTDSMIDLDHQIEEVLSLNLKYQNLATQVKGQAKMGRNGLGITDGSARSKVRPSSASGHIPTHSTPVVPSNDTLYELRQQPGARRGSGSAESGSERSLTSHRMNRATLATSRSHIGPARSARSSMSSSKSHPNAAPVFSPTLPPFGAASGPPRMPLPPSPASQTGTVPSASTSVVLFNHNNSPSPKSTILSLPSTQLPAALNPSSMKSQTPQAQINSLTYALHSQRSQYEALAAQMIHVNAQWDEERLAYERRVSEMDSQLLRQLELAHMLQDQIRVVREDAAVREQVEPTEDRLLSTSAADRALDKEVYEKRIEEQNRKIEALSKQVQILEQEKYAWERERKGLRWLIGQGSSRVPVPEPLSPRSLAPPTLTIVPTRRDEMTSQFEVSVSSTTALGSPSTSTIQETSRYDVVVIQRPKMKRSVTLPALDVTAAAALSDSPNRRNGAYLGPAESPSHFSFAPVAVPPPSPTRMSMDESHLKPLLLLGGGATGKLSPRPTSGSTIKKPSTPKEVKRTSFQAEVRSAKRRSFHAGLDSKRNSLHAVGDMWTRSSSHTSSGSAKKRPSSAIGLGEMLEELKNLGVEVGTRGAWGEGADAIRPRRVTSVASTVPSTYSQNDDEEPEDASCETIKIPSTAVFASTSTSGFEADRED